MWFCLTAMAYAEVYKCKSAGGAIEYMDKPCPNSSSEVNMTKPVPPSQSSTRSDQAHEFHPIANNPAVKPNKKYQRYEPSPRRPLSQHDIEQLHALEIGVERIIAERAKRCQDGDQKECIAQSCVYLDMRKGPAEELFNCAKGKNMLYGRNWVLTQGVPMDNDPQHDPILLESALTPQLPAGKHPGFAPLTMTCIKKDPSSAEYLGSDRRFDENLYVSKGVNGPVFKRTFSEVNYQTDKTVRPVIPEFSTLQELADHICEK